MSVRIITPEDPLWDESYTRFRDPRADESLASYVLWLDELNQLPAGTTLRTISKLGVGPSKVGSPGTFRRATILDLDLLSRLAGGLPLLELEGLTLRPLLHWLFGSMERPALGGTRYRICPQCVAERGFPLLFFFEQVRGCARHGVLLVERCWCDPEAILFPFGRQDPFHCHALGCGQPYAAIPSEPLDEPERAEVQKWTDIYEALLVHVRSRPDPVARNELVRSLRHLIYRSGRPPRDAYPLELRLRGEISISLLADTLHRTSASVEDLLQVLADSPSQPAAATCRKKRSQRTAAHERGASQREDCPNPYCPGLTLAELAGRPLLLTSRTERQCRACGTRFRGRTIDFSFDDVPGYDVRRSQRHRARLYGLRREVAHVCECWVAEGRTIVRAHVFKTIGVEASVAWSTKRAGLVAIIAKYRVAQLARRRPMPPSNAELDRDPEFARRVHLFARAEEIGVRRACDEQGLQNTWYYRWKPRVDRGGFAVLRASAPQLSSSDRSDRRLSRPGYTLS